MVLSSSIAFFLFTSEETDGKCHRTVLNGSILSASKQTPPLGKAGKKWKRFEPKYLVEVGRYSTAWVTLPTTFPRVILDAESHFLPQLVLLIHTSLRSWEGVSCHHSQLFAWANLEPHSSQTQLPKELGLIRTPSETTELFINHFVILGLRKLFLKVWRFGMFIPSTRKYLESNKCREGHSLQFL
jgi:hypothetical protein